MYKEKIFNVETNEETYRDYTPEEVADVEENRKKNEAELIAELEAQALKAAEKNALLAKLGITDDEAKLLLS